MSEPIVVGDTVEFKATVYKDGSAWDVTGGTVTLYLKSPAGTTTPYTATGGNGTGTYTGDGTELTSSGVWKRRWLFVKGGVTLKSKWFQFNVED